MLITGGGILETSSELATKWEGLQRKFRRAKEQSAEHSYLKQIAIAPNASKSHSAEMAKRRNNQYTDDKEHPGRPNKKDNLRPEFHSGGAGSPCGEEGRAGPHRNLSSLPRQKKAGDFDGAKATGQKSIKDPCDVFLRRGRLGNRTTNEGIHPENKSKRAKGKHDTPKTTLE